ncbi:hypothetical protein [Nonomuraea africana]|uniref:hypothetical protein n=1 Tax=Nonomuraea africana TaxID=46171 RepID=UPI0034026271
MRADHDRSGLAGAGPRRGGPGLILGFGAIPTEWLDEALTRLRHCLAEVLGEERPC